EIGKLVEVSKIFDDQDLLLQHHRMDRLGAKRLRRVWRKCVHAERRDRLFDEILRRVHADSRPVREITLVVRAQSPVRRPAKIKQHDVAAPDSPVFGFPLADETSRYVIALVTLAAIEARA